MNTPAEDRFRASYAAFERSHAEQRDAVLAALPQTPLVAGHSRFRRAITGLAAALFIGLGIAAFFAIRPAAAYGLEGLRERIQALRSLYIKGWLFQKDKTKLGEATLRFPVERYFQRPSRFYTDSYGFSIDEKGALIQATHLTLSNDGQRATTILHNEKKAISAPSDALDAELFVEDQLQISEMDRIISGMPQDYERIGTETVRDVWCDIYQSKVRNRNLLWQRIAINPTNGLPTRVTIMERGSDGKDESVCEYVEIRADADPPPGMFPVKVPSGFATTEIKDQPNDRKIVEGISNMSGKQQVALWAALNIDDRGILLCWSQSTEDKGKQRWFHDVCRFVLHSTPKRECTEHKLYETVSGDTRWRWSLIAPNDKKSIGFNSLSVGLRKGRGPALSARALMFTEDRLDEIVERVQRRSLEASGDFGPVKSLAELRKIIASGANPAVTQDEQIQTGRHAARDRIVQQGHHFTRFNL
jgi:hypothetical protein